MSNKHLQLRASMVFNMDYFLSQMVYYRTHKENFSYESFELWDFNSEEQFLELK